jgi:hypothetical protein
MLTFGEVKTGRKAVWKNGKKTATGTWRYVWSSDTFVIVLASGTRHIVKNDRPEWGNWKIQD